MATYPPRPDKTEGEEVNDETDKTQRLVNLLKQRDSMMKTEKEHRAEYKKDLDDVEDAIYELTIELDQKETIELV